MAQLVQSRHWLTWLPLPALLIEIIFIIDLYFVYITSINLTLPNSIYLDVHCDLHNINCEHQLHSITWSDLIQFIPLRNILLNRLLCFIFISTHVCMPPVCCAAMDLVSHKECDRSPSESEGQWIQSRIKATPRMPLHCGRN